MAETPATADRKRSPGYPIIDLEEAIAKASTLYAQDHGAPATAEVIADHWRSKTTSSAFMQWVASLKRFGLLIESPSTTNVRQLKLTKAALDLLLLPREDPRHAQRLKEAALLPKIHAELWKTYGLKLPSDANLRHYLITARGFKHASAEELIQQYRRTITFANLSEGDKLESDQAETDGDATLKPGTRFLQDMVPAMFDPPQPPRGQETKRKMQGQAKQDVFTLDEGPVVFQWPANLSGESFRDLADWMRLQLRKIGRSAGLKVDDNLNVKEDLTADQNGEA